MATNQESIVAGIESLLGLSGLNYNEAIRRLALSYGIAESDTNSMLAQYLALVTNSSETNINGLLAAYAAQIGVGNVNEISDITSDSFISSWKTDNAGTSTDTQITIPTVSGGSYNCTVDWGDGTSDTITTYNDSAWTHEYGASGTYNVIISGTFQGYRFANGGDKSKILNIYSWGNSTFGNQNGVFHGCENLTITAPDVLNTSSLTSMLQTFRGCSSITTIPRMNEWDVSNVLSLSATFTDAANFNEDISNWNTSSVTNMNSAFTRTSFNQDIGGWDTSSVNNIGVMFRESPFDQDIGGWDVTSVNSAIFMFFGGSLSTANYDSLLIGWEAQNLLTGVSFSAGSATYSAGAAATARAVLVSTSAPPNGYSWTITDGGPA